MACRKYRKFFSAYLDGELDALERHRFEHHLAECPRCAAEFAGFREMVALTNGLPPIQPSRDFERSLRAKLPESEDVAETGAIFGRRAVAAIGAICLLLAIISAVYIYDRAGHKDHQGEDEHARILVGEETMPMVQIRADRNAFTNFVMPSVPPIKTSASSSGDIGTVAAEDWQDTRAFVLPSVTNEHEAQNQQVTNYVLKKISLISTSDKTGL